MAQKEDGYIPLILYPVYIAFIIIYIVFTILTLGIFLPADEEKKDRKRIDRNASEEERIRVVLGRKKHRLRSITDRIHELNLIKQKITLREKRILFFVRLLMASILVAINVLYLSCFFETGKFNFSYIRCRSADNMINALADFNACILLLYSLAAYILYGTIGRFTTAMKLKTSRILRKKHIPTLSELQSLKEEEAQLNRDISHLRLQLEQFQ